LALTTPSHSLLGRVAIGEPGAARHCIAQYGPLVWSIARRMAPSSREAEDAVQEIFIELWKHAGRYDPAQASEPAFVTMIARGRMIDRLRHAGRRPQLEPMPDALVGEQHDAIERCAEASLAASALAALDPRQRRVLTLAIGHGMTHAEISDATEMPIAAVKSLVRRALVAVRKRIVDFGQAVEGRG
jgi:RNA polymerase sigma-70 factor (ECF subfamily)